MAFASINPTTGDVVARFAPLDERALEDKLQRAALAFAGWRRIAPAARAEPLGRAAAILRAERESYARLIVEEMGKTIRDARAEVDKCAWALGYYADEGARMLAEEIIVDGDERRSVIFLPLGAVLAVMPWNFPFWQVIRFAAPSLMAGNVGLLKHASNVPRCALALEALFARAGLPEGAFQNLFVEVGTVPSIIADARVAAVTLTGSEAAGARVAEVAGRCLKKTVLELGGSDPFIVMPSADVATALRTAVAARLLSNGQSCIAAKRFIVHASIYDRFAAELCERLAALTIGDPLGEDTDVGPLATERGRQALVAQVEGSVALGARRLGGAAARDGRGWFFTPGALADIPEGAPAYREEVFGPVALLFRARDLDHAIALANDSRYGLGSAAWTRDPAEAARFVRELEAGTTYLNGMMVSDPRLPFGGVKQSGYGRELGVFGLRELVNVKTIGGAV